MSLNAEDYRKLRKEIYQDVRRLEKRHQAIEKLGKAEVLPSNELYNKIINKFYSLKDNEQSDITFQGINDLINKKGIKNLHTEQVQPFLDLRRDLKHLLGMKTTQIKGAKKWFQGDFGKTFQNIGGKEERDSVMDIYNKFLEKRGIPDSYFSSTQKVTILAYIDDKLKLNHSGKGIINYLSNKYKKTYEMYNDTNNVAENFVDSFRFSSQEYKEFFSEFSKNKTRKKNRR